MAARNHNGRQYVQVSRFTQVEITPEFASEMERQERQERRRRLREGLAIGAGLGLAVFLFILFLLGLLA